MSAQTPQTVTLNNVGGIQNTIARSEIKTMETSETSAMPSGLETSIDPQQMADLLAFLKNSR
jgi:putative heme-binding domain-containing protein